MMPDERTAELSRSTWPASTITGIPSGPAESARKPTTFPCRDCSSNRPSPVTIMSAVSRSSAKWVCSAMIAAPDSMRPRSASSPAPMPPAAPAPGSELTSRPATASSSSAHASRRTSSAATAAESAPFCGPNTLAAPQGPTRGYSVSDAAISSTSASCSRAASRPPSSVIIPFPPSVHALPPQPDHDPRRPGPQRLRDELPDAVAVGRQRGLRGGRTVQQGQAAGLRAFQVRGATRRGRTPTRHPPWCPTARTPAPAASPPAGWPAPRQNPAAVGLRGHDEPIAGT